MTFMKTGLVLIFVLAVIAETRHIHPRSDQGITEGKIIDVTNDHNTAEMEVVSIMKPKKLSPSNSILFFKSYDPCEDGFKLDYQGICREVWF